MTTHPHTNRTAMFAHCHGPLWRSDDFTRCFKRDYLQTLLPVIFCGISIVTLLIFTSRKALRSGKQLLPTRANGHHEDWEPEELSSSDQEDDDVGSVDLDAAIGDEIDRNAELALRPTVSYINRTTLVEPDKPRGELLVVCLEVTAILGELGIAVAGLLLISWSYIGSIAVWAYIALLAFGRLFFSSSNTFSLPQLWYHTACLYGGQWVCTTLLFRSAIIHPVSRVARDLQIASFTLTTLLLLIALTTRKGNKVVGLEYEGEIPPAKQMTASLISLASFSWADSIIYNGYKNPVELVDVWNLRPKDKAAAILSDYHQLKKTSKLAWHLLKYFKGMLIAQAAWAALSGFLTFVPTLLLKKILEYVENPKDNPTNAAWFYVILLFVAGCMSAIADGQALWIGRHICIRLRGIIIGEIYAKALKRKAGASADKVLGLEKENSDDKKGLWAKLKALGGSKKKSQHSQQTQAQDGKSSDADNQQVTAGAVINLMAVDSFKVAEISAYLHFLWAATPVQAVVAIVLLYLLLGYSSIAGIVTMILLLPINLYIARRFAKIQTKILAATDARIHSTNEVLTNIRIIKYFAWEERFMSSVDETRQVELRYLRTRYILWCFAATIWSGAPILITFLTFLIYTLVEHKPLIPSIAFTALSLFQILRIPLDQLADMVAHVQEGKVSVDRVEEFLSEEDTQKYQQLRHSTREPSGPAIGFEHGTFTWDSKLGFDNDESGSFRLMDLNMEFAIGELNVIAGPTGSGKTSLLMALLGEMTLIEGRVFLPAARSREDLPLDPTSGLTEGVAYCAQQAWLVNDTVKQNIIFASPWNPKRYRDVIHACSLEKDLEILDEGDETLIGEKGVTLSGGQKQRISLARALYCNARHIMLDDILSAVDSHTAKWIFNKALMGPLMHDRTCILVTHNVSLCLPHATFAAVLDNGKVAVQGTADKVIDSGKLTQDFTKSPQSSQVPSRVTSQAPSIIDSDTPTAMNGSAEQGAKKTDKLETPVIGPAKAPLTPKAAALHEEKAVGSIKLHIILTYLLSMGAWFFWTIAAIIFAAQQVSSIATNVWIVQWANAYVPMHYDSFSVQTKAPLAYTRGFTGSTSSLQTGFGAWNFPFYGKQKSTEFGATGYQSPMSTSEDVNDGYYLGVYAVIGLAFMSITFLREGVLFWGSISASKKIHRRLIECVSRAKFRFFDSTPLGQIMNRFSKDIENVDQEIAPVAVGVVHCMASIIAIVIVISVIIPGFLIAGVFIAFLYYLIGRFYISASRDMKRLESVQRSPLYQLFGETLSGMTTIRAYGDERRFIRENLNRVNAHSRPFIYTWATNRWLAFRVDIAGALVSFFAGVFVVTSVGKIDAGSAGLAMTYAVQFTENVLWFVRLYAQNEQNMNSVERIKEYLDVEQESAPIIPDNRPEAHWPLKGEVEFVNYSTRYRSDFEQVLKNLTFKIAPCEKIGVVGRTGAGKSSLALALFRALEAEEGKIIIDDVEIGQIGLKDLRDNIVMVPQDPTLFTGTIRSNLDPFGLFTDEEIFTALRRVQLIGSNLPSRPTSAQPSRPQTPIPTIQTTGPTSAIDHTGNAVPTIRSASEPDLSANAPVENKNIFLNLSSSISESGSNLSQGQRQLLCLARALLKSPKVLLMDEATASIDYATDAKIQETIRELRENTIITIAHRLKTIVDYDRVIVMDQGRVVEMGEPWELLQPIEGEDRSNEGEGKRWFRRMCEMSGELDVLEHEAKKSWESKRASREPLVQVS